MTILVEQAQRLIEDGRHSAARGLSAYDRDAEGARPGGERERMAVFLIADLLHLADEGLEDGEQCDANAILARAKAYYEELSYEAMETVE